MILTDWEPWMDGAVCAQTDPELFFPDRGGSTAEAKKTCLSCGVRAECLQYALVNNEKFGVWGGVSERGRRTMKPRLDVAA
jgi:WhiB family redox-sensing transcriptional regulator